MDSNKNILPSPQYVDLPFSDGGLAGRFDPVRGVLEVQRRGVKHYYDLAVLVQAHIRSLPSEHAQIVS